MLCKIMERITDIIYLIFHQFLPTTSAGYEKGQQMRIQILILVFKGSNKNRFDQRKSEFSISKIKSASEG